MQLYIYSLDDNEIPFYIGVTKNIKSRMDSHKSEAKYREGGIYRFFPPSFSYTILDTIEDHELDFWEKYYISLYKTLGFKLLNTSEGGRIIKPPSLKPLNPKLKIPIYCKCYHCNNYFEPKNRYIRMYCSKKCENIVKNTRERIRYHASKNKTT